MGIKLYGAALSPFVRKTRVFLAEKGLEYEAVHVDPNNPPEDYHKINPLKRIPAMDDDGRILADSAVICAYLERRHPDPALYPQDDFAYARTIWFEKYADYEIAINCTFAVFRNRVVMKLLGRDCDEDKVQKALRESLPPLLDYLEEQLGDSEYLLGDQMTVADIALASQFVNLQHGGEDVDPGRWPHLAAFIHRMHSRDSFRQQIEKERAFIDKVRGS
jgi:glutathione S-transferase